MLIAPIAIIIIIIIIVATAAFAYYVADKTYKVTCYHADKDKERHNNPHIELGEEQYKDLSPKMHELINAEEAETAEEVRISSSRDGTELFGRLYRFSDSPILNIFFHGYRGTALRDGCGGFELSKQLGMNILMVDQRANGRSGGNVITFGIFERYDCRDWVKFAVQRFGSDVKIVLSGVSLGAATVLDASELDLPNVRCIIADCGFTTPKEIICKVAKEQGYPVWLCYPLLKLACRVRAHLDLEESSALEAVKNTKIPILIIHGDDDRYVPLDMGKRLYEACASEKQLLIVHGAPHAASYVVDQKAYRKAAEGFIKKYCG